MEFSISIEAVCAITGFLGAAIGSVLSLAASVHIQKKESERNREVLESEIQKLQLSWKREDTVQSTQELKELASAMADYLGDAGSASNSEVLRAIQRFRATADQKCSELADALDFVIQHENNPSAAKYEWDELLEAYREIHSDKPKQPEHIG